jgi:hypothetical protein
VLEFDPATRTLTRRADLDTPRSLAPPVALDGEMLLFGGPTLRDASTSTAAACRHGGTSRPLAAMPTGRSFHTATRRGDERVLILGSDEAKGGAVESVLICE